MSRKLRVAPLEPLISPSTLEYKVVGAFVGAFYDWAIWQNPTIIVFSLDHLTGYTATDKRISADVHTGARSADVLGSNSYIIKINGPHGMEGHHKCKEFQILMLLNCGLTKISTTVSLVPAGG